MIARIKNLTGRLEKLRENPVVDMIVLKFDNAGADKGV